MFEGLDDPKVVALKAYEMYINAKLTMGLKKISEILIQRFQQFIDTKIETIIE